MSYKTQPLTCGATASRGHCCSNKGVNWKTGIIFDWTVLSPEFFNGPALETQDLSNGQF